MPASRFYQNSQFNKGETIHIEEDEFHHLKNVMRHKEGDCIEVVNGEGSFALGRVQEIQKRFAVIYLESVTYFEKTHDLILLQAMPQANKLEFLLEKGTELGATEFHLFQGDKSVSRKGRENFHRLNLKIISALKQSGRYYLPKIKEISPICHWESSFKHAYFGDLDQKAPLLYEILPNSNEAKTYFFCCGPEAGFSEKEVSSLKEKNFKGVCLHSNILRTETAPLTFLSLTHHHLLIQTHRAVVN